MKDINIILVAGGTASGKTSIARGVAASTIKPTLIEIDDYYFGKDTFDIPVEEINWDHPKTINWEHLLFDVKKIMNGEIVIKSKYDFKTNMHSTTENVTYHPSNNIIIEGIFALHNKELLSLANLRIYVAADSDIRMLRRITRDSKIRQFDLDRFIKDWVTHIKPMHEKYIGPTKANANLIIPNRNQKKDLDVDYDAIHIIKKMLKR